MAELSTVPLRGAAGVLATWANRSVKERGLALMVDTSAEAAAASADLDMPLAPLPVAMLMPYNAACCAELARTALARCLAIGLTAAVHAGRYGWGGTFRITDAIDRAAWDVLCAEGSADEQPPSSVTAPSPAHATA